MAEIERHIVEGYNQVCEHLVQQHDSRFRGRCREESQTGRIEFYDQYGTIEMRDRTGRDQDTIWDEVPTYRRSVTLTTSDLVIPIHTADKIITLKDPTSDYNIAQKRAARRRLDKHCILAATGTAKTGVDGTTSTVLPAGQKVAEGATGLNFEKLNQTLKIYQLNDVDPEVEIYFAYGAEQAYDLRKEQYDNNSETAQAIEALVRGEFVKFMGFTFIPSQLLTKASNTRTCFAWTKGGILLSIGEDITSDINKRPDKQGSPFQAELCMSAGATRMQEELIVEVPCTEA